MPNFAANLSFLFQEHDFLDRFEAAQRAGFKGVEYLFPYDLASPGEIAARLDDNGLTQVLFNLGQGNWQAGERGITALPGQAGRCPPRGRQRAALCRCAGLPPAPRDGRHRAGRGRRAGLRGYVRRQTSPTQRRH